MDGRLNTADIHGLKMYPGTVLVHVISESMIFSVCNDLFSFVSRREFVLSCHKQALILQSCPGGSGFVDGDE